MENGKEGKGMIVGLKVICVTGGIGSGKSAVSHILETLGAAVLDADAVSREIVQKGQKALVELIDYFGDEILDDEGNLDRKKLSDIVFLSNEKLEVLNSITHKYVRERLAESLEIIKNTTNTEMVIFEVVIPFYDWLRNIVDEIWVVTADLSIRINRVMKRNGFSYQQTLDRINSQKSEEDYLKIADKVILNNGTLEELERQVIELFER